MVLDSPDRERSDNQQQVVGSDARISSAEEIDDKDRSKLFESARLPHGSSIVVFLGIDDRPESSSQGRPARVDPQAPQGIPYFALDIGEGEWGVEGGEWGDSRISANAMDGWSAGIFAQGRALIDWNVRNKVSCFISPKCSQLKVWGSFVRRVGIQHTRCGRDGNAIVRRLFDLSPVNRRASQLKVSITLHIRVQTQSSLWVS